MSELKIETLDRFVILEEVGAGGMGVVYSAYDPRLDRRVALKLLHERRHHSDAARARLLREARALARLSHPNVVPVHDAGVIDNHVFIVMAFVEGHTLGSWADEQRTWREVLDAYVQAGRGLAAAHELGVVHRDFKPDNAIVGNDGRVRVLDFGLAHEYDAAHDAPSNPPTSSPDVALDSTLDETAHHSAPEPREAFRALEEQETVTADPDGPAGGVRIRAPDDRDDGALTQPGVMLGTPAYMAPEQFSHAKVGPAADQFSFCASLFRGLYGVRPVPGTSLAEVRDNAIDGHIREPPRNTRVPRWVHAALMRGLAVAPADRYPSMNALLAALTRDPARSRRRVALGFVLVALLGVSVYSLTSRGTTATERCAAAGADIATVWNDERRAAVKRALLDTEHPYAAEAWPLIQTRLDAYTDDWVSLQRKACVDNVRGHESDALLDMRRRCLLRRRHSLATTVSVLTTTTAASVIGTTELISKLPSLRHCRDADALAADIAPPDDPTTARRVDEATLRLQRVDALRDGGRYREALARGAEVIATAEALGYEPFVARALLAHGHTHLSMEDAGLRAQGAAFLRRAARLGLRLGMTALAVEAMARYLFVEGTTKDAATVAPLLAVVPYMQDIASSAPGADFEHALLLNNAGVLSMSQQDRGQARAFFERALAIRERVAESRIELGVIDRNLAMVTPDRDERVALMRRLLDDYERSLGHAHPMSLYARVVYAHFTVDPEEARDLLDPACRGWERYHAEQIQTRRDCLRYLGFLLVELGRADEGADALMRAGQPSSHDRPEDFPEQRLLALGNAQVLRGQPREAVATFDAIIDEYDGAETVWHRRILAHALVGAGLAQQGLGRHERAAARFDRALELLDEQRALNEDVETDQLLARSRMALAVSLAERRRPGDDTRARELVARADAWYRATGAGYERHRRELARWRERFPSQ